MKIVNAKKWNDIIPHVYSYGMGNVSEHKCRNSGDKKATYIYYVLSGEGSLKGRNVAAGQGFLVTADTSHICISSDEKPLNCFWVGLHGDGAYDFCQKHIPVDEDGFFVYGFKDELYEFVKDFFKVDTRISAVKSTSVFLNLLVLHEQKAEMKHANDYISMAKEYMKKNLHREISIREVADNLFINDRYLYNLFIKHENISPKNYLNQLKLEKACSMLASGDYSISEVAENVGFNNVFVFSRFFSKHMHMSPTTYREKH